MQSKERSSEKAKARAFAELGERTWQLRISHPDYSAIFDQLAGLARQRANVQSQLDQLNAAIGEEEKLLSQLNEGFSARIDEVKAQKRAATIGLSQVMSRQRAEDQDLREIKTIQAEIAQYDAQIAAISDEQVQTIRPIDARLSELQSQIRAAKEELATILSQIKAQFTNLGERVLIVRPQAPELSAHYEQLEALSKKRYPKISQPEPAPASKRTVFYLLGGTVVVLLLLVLFWGVNQFILGGDEPRAAAQAYANQIVKENYEGAIAYFDEFAQEGVSEAKKRQTADLFAFLSTVLLEEHGPLESAVTLTPVMRGDTRATITVVWRYEKRDLAQTFNLRRTDSEWLITDLGARIEGELDGETFIAFQSVAQAASNDQSDESDDSESPQETAVIEAAVTEAAEVAATEPPITPITEVTVTEPPIITATPEPTPTPSAFTLEVQLDESSSFATQATVSVLELDQTERFHGALVRFENLPLGHYTVRISAPGFEDRDIEVEARGDQPLPGVITAQLGTPLSLDPNNVLTIYEKEFRRDSYTQLLGITPEGLVAYWSQRLQPKSWSSDFKTLNFVNRTGIGQINAAGHVTLEWEIPLEVQQKRGTSYRPDLQEISYIRNKDVFTLATKEGAEPQRWSRVGLYKDVLGWVDNDSLLVTIESGMIDQVYLLHRDGTNYLFRDRTVWDNDLIFDREGWLRFVHHDGGLVGNDTLHQLGQDRAEVRLELPARGGVFYGWTHDNRYFLIHSHQDEPGAPNGLLALDHNGNLRQIAPNLLSPNRFNLSAWDLAPFGSQIVLSWSAEEQAGLYIADAESSTIQHISNIVPDNVFWPTPDALVYVIEEGDNIGTWRLPLDGGEAEQLFAYRAEKATGTPDGRLLLLANNTLWEYDGTGEARIVGEEGSMRMKSDQFWVWPKKEEEVITASNEAATALPTASPVPLPATPTVVSLDTENAGSEALLSRITFGSEQNGISGIFVMDGNGGNQIRLTENSSHFDGYPHWSPDKKQIAFHRFDGNKQQLYVINADGSGLTLVPTGTLMDGAPDWSPDGAKFAFTCAIEGSKMDDREVCTMNSDGTNLTRLTNNSKADGEAVWSPNGMKIAFYSGRDGNLEVYVMNSDGSQQIRLTNNLATDWPSSWSPDGTKIAFTSDRDGNNEIYVMNSDGSEQIRLTNNPASDFQPAWSADGTQIAFSSDRDGDYEIFVMNSDGTNLRQLTNNSVTDYHPDWEPQAAFDRAAAVAPEETATVVDTAIAVEETPTAVEEATSVPLEETPTAEPTPTEAAIASEAEEASISARVDLRTFDYIIVRDLDGYTGTPYAELAQINNTQTTFSALARSPDNLWIYVRLQDGTTGWIANEYVVANQPLALLPERVPVAPPEIGASINLSGYDFINVRVAPNPNSQQVTEIYDPNTRFVAVGLSQDTQWVLVRLQDGTLGWIDRQFVVGDGSLDGLPKRFYVVGE